MARTKKKEPKHIFKVLDQIKHLDIDGLILTSLENNKPEYKIMKKTYPGSKNPWNKKTKDPNYFGQEKIKKKKVKKKKGEKGKKKDIITKIKFGYGVFMDRENNELKYGIFKNDQFQQGFIINSKGNIFEYGEGSETSKMTPLTGGSFEGEIDEDQNMVKGKYIFPDYVGKKEEDEMEEDEESDFIFENFSSFEGNFLEDKPHGVGILEVKTTSNLIFESIEVDIENYKIKKLVSLQDEDNKIYVTKEGSIELENVEEKIESEFLIFDTETKNNFYCDILGEVKIVLEKGIISLKNRENIVISNGFRILKSQQNPNDRLSYSGWKRLNYPESLESPEISTYHFLNSNTFHRKSIQDNVSLSVCGLLPFNLGTYFQETKQNKKEIMSSKDNKRINFWNGYELTQFQDINVEGQNHENIYSKPKFRDDKHDPKNRWSNFKDYYGDLTDCSDYKWRGPRRTYLVNQKPKYNIELYSLDRSDLDCSLLNGMLIKFPVPKTTPAKNNGSCFMITPDYTLLTDFFKIRSDRFDMNRGDTDILTRSGMRYEGSISEWENRSQIQNGFFEYLNPSSRSYYNNQISGRFGIITYGLYDDEFEKAEITFDGNQISGVFFNYSGEETKLNHQELTEKGYQVLCLKPKKNRYIYCLFKILEEENDGKLYLPISYGTNYENVNFKNIDFSEEICLTGSEIKRVRRLFYPTPDFMETENINFGKENALVKDIHYILEKSDFQMKTDLETNLVQIEFRVENFFEVEIKNWHMVNGRVESTEINIINLESEFLKAISDLAKSEKIKIKKGKKAIEDLIESKEIEIFPSFPEFKQNDQRGNDRDITLVFALNEKEENLEDKNERFLNSRPSLIFSIDGSYFSGPAILNQLMGKGTFKDPFQTHHFAYLKNGNFYSSQLFGEKSEILYRNNSKYEGNSEFGIRHGKGKIEYENGEEYDGEWLGGMKQGFGVYKWVNGDKYEGEFKCDMMWGEGVLELADGFKLQGNFSAGDVERKDLKVFDNEGGEVELKDFLKVFGNEDCEVESDDSFF